MQNKVVVPRKTLTVFDAVAIIVGIVIGAGIFRAPSIVAQGTQEVSWFFLAWILGGIISFIGALCYAELATTYPHSGGDYHYLNRAYGRNVSFLFGWARMTVIQPGSIAAVSFVFGDYASQFLPGFFTPPVCAFLAVAILTVVNIMGTAQGKWTQNVLASAMVIGLTSVIIAGTILTPITLDWAPITEGKAAPFGLAMIFIFLTFGGWNEAAYISAEIKEGRRNMLRALMWGIGVVTVVYLLVNVAYVNVLGLEAMSRSRVVAADLMRVVFGEFGAVFVSVLIVICALGTVNGSIFTGARSNYAVGNDFSIFSFLGRWSEKNNTATNALLFQGVLSLLLVLLGSMTRKGFETMVAYTAPIFWLFFLLTGISLFILRSREPLANRPFRVPLYPLTPILFCLGCAYMLRASIVYAGVGAMVGIGVFLLGGILLMIMHQQKKAA